MGRKGCTEEEECRGAHAALIRLYSYAPDTEKGLVSHIGGSNKSLTGPKGASLELELIGKKGMREGESDARNH